MVEVKVGQIQALHQAHGQARLHVPPVGLLQSRAQNSISHRRDGRQLRRPQRGAVPRAGMESGCQHINTSATSVAEKVTTGVAVTSHQKVLRNPSGIPQEVHSPGGPLTPGLSIRTFYAIFLFGLIAKNLVLAWLE